MLTLSANAERIKVRYQQSLAAAAIAGGFLPFRLHPWFMEEARYPALNLPDIKASAHFFSGRNIEKIEQLPGYMHSQKLLTPADLREVFSLGPIIDADYCEYVIPAPEITGRPDHYLVIQKHEGWQGLGLTITTWDPPHNDLITTEFIGFTKP